MEKMIAFKEKEYNDLVDNIIKLPYIQAKPLIDILNTGILVDVNENKEETEDEKKPDEV